ncbi:MAG: OmpA family protein [Myxococcaceae bacterium]|nr:OmpA family protein [Myxococcaceae bacterium]
MHTRPTVPLMGLFVALAIAGCAAKSQDAALPKVEEIASAEPSPAPVQQPVVTDEGSNEPPPTFEPIHYALDSAELLPESRRELARLAEHLRRRPGATVEIAGHTCELGTSEYNLALGQKRAAAARDYLVKLGVDPERITIISFGEERPLDDEHTEPARAKNRRSEFDLHLAMGRTR